MAPIGCDFQWRNATFSFQMVDGFIALMNKYKSILKMNGFYSTVPQYFEDLNTYSNKNKIQYETKSDDFFP